jgi:AhpD family alkylhydroperoxidase
MAKVGILACSGEECLGGTLSRMAARSVLEKNGNVAVTLCLPLYIAGGEEERSFAKTYPVISVDGCSKLCAKKATQKYSGEVHDSIDISTIIGTEAALSKVISARDLTDEHKQMAQTVAGEIQKKVSETLKGKIEVETVTINRKENETMSGENKRMLAEFFPEFVRKFDEIDELYRQKRLIDEKTYQYICFAVSIKARSKPCVLKHFKGALDAGATVQELSYIFALVMREAAGADDCWTHDVLGDWQDIVKGTVDCGCPK